MEVTLENGAKAKVVPGSLLPGNLHPDFEFFTIPGESIAAAKDSNIFVRTSVAMRDLNIGHARKRGPAETEHVLESVGRAIRNAMPGHDRVYASMMRGERRGKTKWQAIVDDFNIVLSDMLVRGETISVLLAEPSMRKVVVEGKELVAVEAPMFYMNTSAPPA